MIGLQLEGFLVLLIVMELILSFNEAEIENEGNCNGLSLDQWSSCSKRAHISGEFEVYGVFTLADSNFQSVWKHH